MMSVSGPTHDPAQAGNGAASAVPTSNSTAPPPWSSQPSALSASAGPPAGFGQFSATTAEILNRIRAGNTGPTTGTPAFEAKRAEVLQNYVTSDKLPTPPPIANTGRRGKGGRAGTPSGLKSEVVAANATGGTPTSARASGRGRGKGRGGRSGRGGKRKRSDSFESEVCLGNYALHNP
jgi:hypothetical protein